MTEPYNDAHDILPDEQCIMCGEKHYSYAMELASEVGYVAVNNQKIIGQLVASQWHVNTYDEKLANDIRDIRHYVQERTPELINWKPICIRLEELVRKDKEESLKKYSDAVSWMKSLVGEKILDEDKLKYLYDSHSKFLSEMGGGGCSSCKLKRLKGKYRNLLTEKFS